MYQGQGSPLALRVATAYFASVAQNETSLSSRRREGRRRFTVIVAVFAIVSPSYRRLRRRRCRRIPDYRLFRRLLYSGT